MVQRCASSMVQSIHSNACHSAELVHDDRVALMGCHVQGCQPLHGMACHTSPHSCNCFHGDKAIPVFDATSAVVDLGGVGYLLVHARLAKSHQLEAGKEC